MSSHPAVDPDFATGEVVGEYVVDGKLGQGAFGTVYRGAHPLIGKQVAIKVLARKYSVDPEITSRFVAEARAVNQIRNKNIIDIFSFGTLPDGRQYYVMEYLDGEPLDALIERSGRIGLADALPILRGIARALDAAHAKSIAHRDLKAENVFLASDGDGVWPKLLDFGIAKLLSDDTTPGHKTRTGYSIGTPYYMSPEQARGRDVDHRTDIYAFGVLAYVMLVGKYPFDGDDFMEILMHQLQDQPVPASILVPELPASVDDAIGWLMAKDPADRPPALRDAIAAFERAAEEAGITTAAPTWDTGPVMTAPPRIARPAPTASAPAPRRRAGLLAGLAIAIVVAGIGIAVATRAPDETPATVAPPAAQPVVVAPPAQPVVIAPPAQPVVIAIDAPAAIDAPEAPRTITITITGTPANTEVLVAGVLFGTAPGPVQLPAGTDALVLTFKADGYLPASREVTPDHDHAVSISLKRRGTGKRPTRDDLIDVFDKKP